MSPLCAFALAKSKLRLYCLALNGMYVAHTDLAKIVNRERGEIVDPQPLEPFN